MCDDKRHRIQVKSTDNSKVADFKRKLAVKYGLSVVNHCKGSITKDLLEFECETCTVCGCFRVVVFFFGFFCEDCETLYINR